MPDIERRRIYFSGHVQGVGFRNTAERLARGYDVAGYVRNLSDGRVELVVEGRWPSISEFLAAIVTEMEPYVHDVSSETETIGEQLLTGFRIQH